MSSFQDNDLERSTTVQDPPVALKLIAFVSAASGLERPAIRSAFRELRRTDESLQLGTAQVETRVLTLVASGAAPRAGDVGQSKMLGTSVPIPYGMIEIRLPAACSAGRIVTAQLAAELGWSRSALLKERIHLDGQPRAGAIVRVGLMTRRPDIARSDFERLWAGDHARLVLESGPLFHRYATNILVGDEAWDGIIEQWFDSDAQCAEHDRRVAEEKPVVRADVGRFLGKVQTYIGRTVDRMTY